MAKTEKPTTVGGFVIETGVELPAVTRLVGGEKSPFTEPMKALEIGQSFFIPATIPDTITDETERKKAAKEEARKVSNRVSGLARRLTKADESKVFALRTMEHNGAVGVRVYRIEKQSEAA